MRCEFCQGSGYVLQYGFKRIVGFDPVEVPEEVPCPECHGSGIVSCCEGSERHGQLPGADVSDHHDPDLLPADTKPVSSLAES